MGWLAMIDRFGAQAVFGRTLGYGEMQRMMAVESVYRGTKAKNAAPNQVEWAKRNEQLDQLITKGMLTWRAQQNSG